MKQLYQRLVTVCAVLYSVLLLETTVGNEENFVQANNVCSCPNDVLIYTCTVVGGTATVWGGSAFDCPTGGIILLHSEFLSGSASGSCNNGAIVGQSIGFVADNNCYTSQLNITLNMDMNNRSIQCQGMSRVGGAVLSVVPVVPPSNVSLAGVNRGRLTFSWTPAASSCPIGYQTTFDCGSCPSMTQATTQTCSDLQISTSERLCVFRIQSVCKSFMGNQSNSVVVTLKAPDIPEVKITPIYFAETQTLSRINFNISEEVPFTISDGILSSVESYNISYYYDDDNKIDSSIYDSPGDAVIQLQITDCARNNISVSISAISKLGEGQFSNPYTAGCSNTFVVVKYISENFTISCMFLNKSDTSNKSCNVMYGQCNEVLTQFAEGYGIHDTILLLLSIDLSQSYCYMVKASSDIGTAMVEGRIAGIGQRNTVSNIVVVVVIPLCLVAIVLLILLGLVFTVSYLKFQRKSKDPSSADLLELEETNSPSDVTSPAKLGTDTTQTKVTSTEALPPNAPSDDAPSDETSRVDPSPTGQPTTSQYTPPTVDRLTSNEHTPASYPDDKYTTSSDVGIMKKVGTFVVSFLWGPVLDKIINHKFRIDIVDKDCELREYIKSIGRTYKRGCAYYEMCREGEVLSKDQELILEKENEYYYPPEDYKAQLCWGIVAKPPADYRVFIQYIGSGARYLQNGSRVLVYKAEEHEQPYCIEKLPLREVISDQIAAVTVQKKMNLSDFMEENEVKSKKIGNIFLEFGTFIRECRGRITDVILRHKDTKKFFTGPNARLMVQGYYQRLYGTDPESLGEKSPDMIPQDNQDKDHGSINDISHSSDTSTNDESTNIIEVENAHNDVSPADDPHYQRSAEDTDLINTWTIFVATSLKGNIQFEKNEPVLYQGRPDTMSTFVVIYVDKDNVQMYEFVNKKLDKRNKPFQNGRVFYQLSEQGQDLLYYKDIVHPTLSDMIPGKELKLQTKIEWFYSLRGVPGEGIRPSNEVVFVQSNCNGSRCLKKGTKLLYKVDDPAEEQRGLDQV